MITGKDFLLKRGDGEDPEEFETIGAQRSTSMSIDGTEIDISAKDTSGWQELLGDGGGIRSMSISIEGIYKSEAEQTAVRDQAMDGELKTYQLDDGAEVLECDFLVSDFEQSGDHDGEQTYSATLSSSGEPTITDST